MQGADSDRQWSYYFEQLPKFCVTAQAQFPTLGECHVLAELRTSTWMIVRSLTIFYK